MRVASFYPLKPSDAICSKKSSVEFFETFFDMAQDYIVKKTVRYAITCKNYLSFTMTQNEVIWLLGLLLLSDYYKAPLERHYWFLEEDLGLEIVSHCLSRNKWAA